MTARKRWPLVWTTAVLCLAAGSVYAQKPAASRTAIDAPAGFHIVLLLADNEPGKTVEHLPAGVMKALKDASEFLHYKRYALQDAALVRGARPSSDPQAVRLQAPGGREYIAKLGSGPTYPATEQSWFVSLNVVDLSDKEILRTGFDIHLGETVVVGTSKVKDTDQALVVLLTALSDTALAGFSQEPPATKKPAPAVKVSEFNPPLSVGKERRYDRDFAGVEKAVREAITARPWELLREQKVGAMWVFEAMPRSVRNMPGRDSVRIVVEPVSEKRTAVRVFWPAAAAFSEPASGGSTEGLVFRAIEARLPSQDSSS